MKKTTFACVSGLALAFAGAAHGQVSPIGQFTGDFSEPFSMPSFGFAPCVPGGVFQGTATLCASSAHVTGSWGFSCSIFNMGSNFFGSTGGPAEYVFQDPIREFGGFMGTNAPASGGSIQFFDVDGNLVGSDVIDTDPCGSWKWHGWESTGAAIKRIIVKSNYSQGGWLMMENMEYNLDTGAGCYPDCDENGTLNVDDFICFQLEFALQTSYADCDGNQVHNIDDFLCFQLAFALGC